MSMKVRYELRTKGRKNENGEPLEDFVFGVMFAEYDHHDVVDEEGNFKNTPKANTHLMEIRLAMVEQLTELVGTVTVDTTEEE